MPNPLSPKSTAFDNGRLQTAEHIMAKLLEEIYPDARIGVCRFFPGFGQLELTTGSDPREMNTKELESRVNDVISQNLEVSTHTILRAEADQKYNTSKLPEAVSEVRIVQIGGFDKRPCRDSHVSNTGKIGNFLIQNIKRVGRDRYRIKFVLVNE